jgi:sugar phosphate isomerase/epimerase
MVCRGVRIEGLWGSEQIAVSILITHRAREFTSNEEQRRKGARSDAARLGRPEAVATGTPAGHYSGMTLDRRTFLASIGSATAAVIADNRIVSVLPGALAARKRLDRLGIQLYTVRGPASTDLVGTLAKLAEIGYKEVEFAGYYNHTAAEIRSVLQQYGLTAPSAHIAITALENESQKTFDDARAIGHDWLTVPSLPNGAHDTIDDWKRVAANFNAVAARVRAAGFRFAYHNHNTELKKIGHVLPLDVLIEETDPTLVSFEMDIYWVVNGGGDPLALLARHPGRIKMLHVKDSLGLPDDKMADVGAGTIDFKTIFARANGIEHYFVEHDHPADAFASAKASFQYLANLEF